MEIGEAIGYFIPLASGFVKPFSCGNINIPLTEGLMWMRYPTLAKELYEKMGEMFKHTKILWPSLSLN